MAETAPPSDSPVDRIQRWLEQDGASRRDVSYETSSPEPEGPEPEAAAEESDDYQPEPNAQLEGDEGDEPSPIRSFSDLAKRLEIEEDALAKHLLVSGADGKEVSLHDVLTSYRAPKPEQAEFERARARLTELEAGREEAARAAEELRQTAQALAKHMRTHERTPEQWAQLERENPTAFLSERFAQMERMRQLEHADRQYQAMRQQQVAEQQRQVAEFRREQAHKLRAAVPAWSDTKVMQSELEGISQYLVRQGISEQEVEQLTDHRDWLIARKAMLYDEIQAKKPAVLEKVKQLPRVIAPGVSSGADRGSSARRAAEGDQLLARVKETGRVEDAAAAIAHRLAGSARRAAGRQLASGRRS